jgi:hypothetical protein
MPVAAEAVVLQLLEALHLTVVQDQLVALEVQHQRTQAVVAVVVTTLQVVVEVVVQV